MIQMQKNILAGNDAANAGFHSANEVRTVPKAFKDWVENNQDRIVKAKALPYFLRDNGKIVDGKWVYQKPTADAVGTGAKVAGRYSDSLHSLSGDLRNGKGYQKGEFVEVSMSEARKLLLEMGSGATHEEAYIKLADGRMLHKKSEVMGVTFDKEECKLLKDAVILHNHDRGTLSNDDIITSLRHGAKSISAIADGIEYKAAFSDESYSIAKIQNLVALYYECEDELHMKMMRENSRVFDAYRANMQEEQIKYFCKKINATYSKRHLQK